MASANRNALLEGIADALGFVLGALAGWWVGQAFGFDFVRTPGYGAPAAVGLVFIVLGCGAGRWISRRLLALARQRRVL